METWEAIAARRNVRSYRDRPIPRGHLDRILDAGRRSPSSRNQQLWDFVVVTDKKQLEELSKVWQGAGHVGASAATVALVAPLVDDPDTRETIQYDLGQVTLSMMLAAADLGIGSGHAWVRDQPLARKVLQMPQDRECAWLIAFGYPSDRPLAPLKNHDRRDFADVVHRDHW